MVALKMRGTTTNRVAESGRLRVCSEIQVANTGLLLWQSKTENAHPIAKRDSMHKLFAITFLSGAVILGCGGNNNASSAGTEALARTPSIPANQDETGKATP